MIRIQELSVDHGQPQQVVHRLQEHLESILSCMPPDLQNSIHQQTTQKEGKPLENASEEFQHFSKNVKDQWNQSLTTNYRAIWKHIQFHSKL